MRARRVTFPDLRQGSADVGWKWWHVHLRMKSGQRPTIFHFESKPLQCLFGFIIHSFLVFFPHLCGNEFLQVHVLKTKSRPGLVWFVGRSNLEMIKISLQSYGFRNGCHGLAGGRCLENNILAMHIRTLCCLLVYLLVYASWSWLWQWCCFTTSGQNPKREMAGGKI